MGLSTKPVSGDQGLDWGQTFLQSAVAATETSKPPSTRRQQPLQQQQQAEPPLKCPRCSSINTKFCYYNNYNKSQPRHFCKSCKRHWTKGGTLRNVPVGGGRKNKRPKITKPSAKVPPTTAALRHQDFSTTTSGGGGGQKSMSNILYHALIGRSSSTLLHETSKGIENIIGGATTAASAPPQMIPNTEFNLSCLTTFDMNASLNPASYHQPFDQFGANLDTMEESTITTVNMPGCSSGPWPGPESSSTLDLPNYNWNWNDIDVLTSGDLSISWDDNVDKGVNIKP